MFRGTPLFNGQRELELLESIFQYLLLIRIIGQPNEEECKELDRDMVMGDQQPRPDLADFIPCLDYQGLDLLSQMLCLNPVKRPVPRIAMRHPYFRGLDCNQKYDEIVRVFEE